jgi:hypothetical protein
VTDFFIQDQVADYINPHPKEDLPQIRKGVVQSVDFNIKQVSVQLHGSSDTVYGIPWVTGVTPVVNNDIWLFKLGNTMFAWAHNPYTWQAVTLGNSWANSGSPYFNAGYRITVDGQVWLRGVIINGTANAVAFTLPVGARPTSRIALATLATTTPTVCRLHVEPSGAVIPVQSGTFVTLDNVRFDMYP